MLGLGGREHLREDVRGHVVSGTIDQADFLFFDGESDKVEANVDMLGASVKTVVVCKSDRALVVAVDGDRVGGSAENFDEK